MLNWLVGVGEHLAALFYKDKQQRTKIWATNPVKIKRFLFSSAHPQKRPCSLGFHQLQKPSCSSSLFSMSSPAFTAEETGLLNLFCFPPLIFFKLFYRSSFYPRLCITYVLILIIIIIRFYDFLDSNIFRLWWGMVGVVTTNHPLYSGASGRITR